MQARFTLAFCALIVAIAVGGCERPHSEEAAKNEKQIELPSVAQTVELKSAHAANQLNGIATILNPDALLQIDADIKAATIAADFSKGTADRYRTTHALSRQTVENAERQAGTDSTQQKLLETRLKHTWGEQSPFLQAEQRQALISELSAGNQVLVRLDFPDLASGQPRDVRVAPLSGGGGTAVKTMWVAPSGNQSMPGISYFALIDAGPGLRPGDRARLTAEGSETSDGVVVPNAAIVVYAGQSWCYIETAPQKFQRRAVALDFPISDGYLVKSGLTAGMRVVVRGASLLLSREAGPGEDDDDEGAVKKPSGPADNKPAPPKPEASEKASDPPVIEKPAATKEEPEKSETSSISAAKSGANAATPDGKDPD